MTIKMNKVLSVAVAATLCLGSASAAANGLNVEAVHGSVTPGQSEALGFQISNDGTEAIHDLRWFGVAGFTLDCAMQTVSGRGFGIGSDLQAGDRAHCSMTPASPQPGLRSAAVVVSARAVDGSATVRHAGIAAPGGAVTPAQGIVVVVGGAVHADIDLDGVLDIGETIAYDYTLVNAGTEALSALALEDLSGAVACPATTLAVGAALTCTRSFVVTGVDEAAGFVLNEVNVLGTAANGDAVQAADVLLTLNHAGSAGIRVFKSPMLLDDVDGSGYASVADVLGYTFVVKNSNAQTLGAVDLVEPDPSLIDTPIVCAATTLGGQAFSALGSATLLSNDVVLCSAEHAITPAEVANGAALNLAEASGTAAIGGPISGTGASAVGIPAAPLLAVSKTVSASTILLGGTVTYAVTVSNLGSTDIANVTINDPMPTGITQFTWTCAGTGAVCPNGAGTGALSETVAVFPAGGQLVYTILAQVSPSAPSPILNTVTVTPQTSVLCLPGNVPPPCTASVPLGTGSPIPLPLDDRSMLVLMALLLVVAAARRSRRDGRIGGAYDVAGGLPHRHRLQQLSQNLRKKSRHRKS